MTAMHGTARSYRDGCRCTDCRVANTEDVAVRRKARTVKGLKHDDPRHGLATTYVNWGCRCERCSAAHADEMKRQVENRWGTPPPTHGVSGYNAFGCRCDICTKAAADYQTAARQRGSCPPFSGVNRNKEWTGPELEMAMRTDLTLRQIAEALGRSREAVSAARRRINRGEPRWTRLLGARSSA